jgi:hypothetical protein
MRENAGGAAFRVEAGDAVHDFLGQGGAVEVVGVAADPVHLVCVREVDALSIGDPDGPLDDPAVAVVDLDVTGPGAAVRGDLGVDVPLQSRLVAFTVTA